MQDTIHCRGIDFPNDSRFITGKVAKRLSRGMYETPEVRGLPKFIRPSDRVLELGGGIGFISSYLVAELDVSDLTCVEANPELCGYIRQVHAANDVRNVTVENAVALPDDTDWPADGALPFYITEPFWSSSLSEPEKGRATMVRVPAIRLSDLISRTRPSVIVCDIEGGEASLFGAVDLTGVHGVYMELHTRSYGGHGVRKVFDDMHRNGFYYHQKASCADVVYFERLMEL